MYRDIKFNEGLFTAVDENDTDTIIEKSISDLYLQRFMRDGAGNVTCILRPITYRDGDILKAVERLFIGELNVEDVGTLIAVQVRYGWLDCNLNRLEWNSLLALHQAWHVNKLTKTDKGKIQLICKALSLSRTKLVKVGVGPLVAEYMKNFQKLQMAELERTHAECAAKVDADYQDSVEKLNLLQMPTVSSTRN